MINHVTLFRDRVASGKGTNFHHMSISDDSRE